MNILYLTSDFRFVQPQIVESFKRKVNTDSKVFLYKIRTINKAKPPKPYVKYYEYPSKLPAPIFYLCRLRKIAKYLSDSDYLEDVDVIHANMTVADGYIARLAAKEKGIDYVVSFRDTDLNTWFFWRFPWVKKTAVETMLNAKAVIFLSETYKKKLLQKVPNKYRQVIAKKATVIPNGIDSFFLNNLNTKKNYCTSSPLKLLFVGDVSKRKNLETVVGAAEMLIKDGIPTKIIVVGKVIDSEYDELIKSTPIIEYYNKCPKEELINFYRKSDILVIPSHTETFGLVYAEAMSQGLPVVYTRGQGFDGRFEDGTVGYSVNDINPQEIKEKIKKIMDNYQRISLFCSNNVNKFDWSYVTDRFIDLYSSES